MKKILALFSLLATPLLANEQYDPCCEGVGFEIYGEFLYLQPNASNLHYAAEAIPRNLSLPDPILEANWINHDINPDYHPAFEIGAGFLFRSMEMALLFNWERISTTDIRQFSVPVSLAMVGPVFDIGPDAAPYIAAKGKATFRFDLANMILEKRVFSQNCWTIDLCVGAEFARIKEYLRNQYNDGGAEFERIIRSPSTFMGAGPVFGVNVVFQLIKHLQFTGSSSFALLMGQLKNITFYRSYSPFISSAGNPQPTTERSRVPNRTQLVPGFEEKLGFALDFPYRCGCFTLEAGYQFQIYLNAIQSYDMTVIVDAADLPFPSTVGYYAQGFQRILSNFILTGPYVKMSLNF